MQAAATIAQLIDQFHAATDGLQRLPAPVIASVHGAAAGGGFSLALAADFRIAADTATFTPAYLRLGTSPDGGGTFFLRRLVGPSKALEMFLLGRTYAASDALGLGIVNRVVPAADLARSCWARCGSAPKHSNQSIPLVASLAFAPMVLCSHGKRL